MNKIEFPRTGVDGVSRTKSEIEEFYISGNILNDIKNKLGKIHRKRPQKLKDLLLEITDSIEKILLLSPAELQDFTKRIDAQFPGVFSKTTKGGATQATRLGNQVLAAFNYKGYRENKLVDLSKKLNVKCCPYCNMHYTLYAEKGDKRKDQLTKFQFDHFYAKSKYPMLSMSLYNLIPSCAVCNQGKSDTNLSLDFHPYHSEIHKQFTFTVHDPIGLFSGDRIKDEIDIDIQSNNIDQKKIEAFIKTFHLKTLYQRHGDIAQETFDKAYEKEYYQQPSNFRWLSNASPEYIRRLWMGVYPDENDIEKRPMSKFIQDLWKQARNIQSEINIDETNE